MSFTNNTLEDRAIASTSIESDSHKFSHLYSAKLHQNQCPIVYTNEYNISFFGIEKLHPFDSQKWGRVFQFLVGKFFSFEQVLLI
jgi:histone deacetylase 11